MPTSGYSLEEQIYKAMAVMVNQPMRHAIIKLPKKDTEMVTTPFVEEIHIDDEEEKINNLKEEHFKSLNFVNPRVAIEEEITQRWLEIEEAAQPPEEREDYKE